MMLARKYLGALVLALIAVTVITASASAEPSMTVTMLAIGFGGMLNRIDEPLPAIAYSSAPVSVDLARGMYMKRLECRVSAGVTIAGGTTSGTAFSDGCSRLIREISIKWDNFDLVQRISGRDLYALTKRGVLRAPTGSELANGDAQVATQISCAFNIYFARPWLFNDWDTVLPPLPITSQFKIYVTWETAKANAGSAEGTGALVTGSDRTVTFSTAPSLQINQVLALRGAIAGPGSAGDPWYIPVLTSMDAEQFAAANPRLTLQLVNNRRFDSVLLQMREGADQVGDDDLLNALTFQTTGVRYINAKTAAMLHEFEQYQFPAVGDGGADAGSFFLRVADDGKLGNVVEPEALSSPRFELDVNAPGSGPGVAHFVFCELLPHATLTQIKP